MPLDPYKPPAARVEDRGEEEDLAGRPRQVVLACYILWVALALGLLLLLPDWWRALGETVDDEEDVADTFLYGAVVIGAVFVVAYAALIYLVGRRNDFARWTLLFLLALGWLLAVGDFFSTLEEAPMEAAAGAVVVAAELWACYLLFLSPGAAWFRRSADRR